MNLCVWREFVEIKRETKSAYVEIMVVRRGPGGRGGEEGVLGGIVYL